MSSGNIQLIIGPMFSGKTTKLLQRIRRYHLTHKKCLLVKHEFDDRYTFEAKIITHDQQDSDPLPVVALSNLQKVPIADYDVIGIDEGQFFNNTRITVQEWANRGKIVIIAGLDADYRLEPFKEIIDLIPVAESVVKLKSVCNVCYKEASFSARIRECQDTIMVGSSNDYTVLCRHCFLLYQNFNRMAYMYI